MTLSWGMYLPSKKNLEHTFFMCVKCVCVSERVSVWWACTYEHTYIVHVRICVIYECTIICVYMGTCIYCVYIKCMLYLCLFFLVCLYCNRLVTLQRLHSWHVVTLLGDWIYSPLVLWCFHVSCSVAAFTRVEPACTNRLANMYCLHV